MAEPTPSRRPRRDEQYRLTLESWFRGIALLLVVIAVVVYPLYALIFKIPGATLPQVIAPITGIAGAVVGYWFGQSRSTTGSARISATSDPPDDFAKILPGQAREAPGP